MAACGSTTQLPSLETGMSPQQRCFPVWLAQQCVGASKVWLLANGDKGCRTAQILALTPIPSVRIFFLAQGWTSKPICISPQIYPPIQCLCKSSAVLALASQHHFLCLHRIRFNAGVADSCYMLSSRISKLTCQINTADLDDILTFA